MRKIHIIFLLFIFSCDRQGAKTIKQINSKELIPFKLSIIEADFAAGGSLKYQITEKDIKIIGRSGRVGQKDSTLFYKILPPTNILKEIGEIELDTLKEEYIKSGVKDGKNIDVKLEKLRKVKSVYTYHYYHETVGRLVNLVNHLVPSEYRIIYKEEFLEHPGNI